MAFIILPIGVLYAIPSKTNKKVSLKYLLSFGLLLLTLISFDSISDPIIDKLNNKRNEQERISYGGYYYIQFDQKNNQRLVRFEDDVKDFESHNFSTFHNSNKDSSLLRLDLGLKYQIYSNGLNSEYLITDSIFSYCFLDSYVKAGSYYDLPNIENLDVLFFDFKL